MRKARGLDSSPFELDFDQDPAILSLIGRGLGLGVFTVDAEGLVRAWSDGAEKITGYDRAEVLGRPCDIFGGPDCRGFERLMEQLSTARAAGPADGSDADSDIIESQECRIYAKDSRELRLLGSARILRHAGGVYGAIACFIDITEVVRANAPAERSTSDASLCGLVGQGPAMAEVFRRIRLASDSDVTTAISGESGTGKELAARAIHQLSDRRAKPFVAVNCAAIPEALLESELFGHVKGAFTGAVRTRPGVLESADGGTLFLDEIGEVSPGLQVKLLRVLQEREIRRVGDDKKISIDVRLLTATNRDLQALVDEGKIREDFYYRIRVFDLHMPPLRERREDISRLAQYFADQGSQRARGPELLIAVDALEALVNYPWPGNVRELQNAIEYARVVQTGGTIGLFDLPEPIRNPRSRRARPIANDPEPLTPEQEAERLRILDALDAESWNRTRTAERLGISRVTLWKKIRRYRIDEGIFKKGSRSRRADL